MSSRPSYDARGGSFGRTGSPVPAPPRSRREPPAGGRRIPKRALLAAGAAVAALALLAGCGGGGGGGAAGGGGSSASESGTTPAPTGNAPPLGPPQAKESIDAARDRITKALESGDCDQIAKLNPLGRPGLNNPKRCAALKRIGKLHATGAASYNGGGIIDYAVGDRTLAAILIVDSDGLYHLVFIDPFGAKPSIGTDFAPQFDDAANKVANALTKRDCKAFLEVASKQIGIGKLGAKRVCPLPKVNPFLVISKNFPSAKPQRLGGNADYAFYSYGTPGVNYTMLMAKQSNEGLPPPLQVVPKGADPYSYLGIYRTNSRKPPAGG